VNRTLSLAAIFVSSVILGASSQNRSANAAIASSFDIPDHTALKIKIAVILTGRKSQSIITSSSIHRSQYSPLDILLIPLNDHMQSIRN
jgi:hypothetical protein